MTDMITLQEYKSQSWVQKVSRIASTTTKDFDGFYKFAKIAISTLTYPILLLNGSSGITEGLTAFREKWKTIKEVNNAVLIASQADEWVKTATDGEFRKKQRFLDVARRVCLTVGGISKTVMFGHSSKLYNLGKFITYSVGKVPLFGAITDAIFFGAFSISAIKGGVKLCQSLPVLKKTKRLNAAWDKIKNIEVKNDDDTVNEAETNKQRREAIANRRQKKADKYTSQHGKLNTALAKFTAKKGLIEANIADLKTKLNVTTDKKEQRKLAKKIKAEEQKIARKTKKASPDIKQTELADLDAKIVALQAKVALETAKPDGFTSLTTRKVTKWEVRKINTGLEVKKAGFGLISDAGKLVCIATSVIAMQIFGWAGLAASLSITTVSLVADLCGFTKFFTNLQGIDEKKSIATACAAAA